ncbi:hypothetical protein ACHMW4_00465 [Mesorhizobium sp. UC22_110]|uniref:hypothetical protein n=1 Tax=Mesorhizobium sp. UC22_110 TaxID=3374552 RepID=UPI0037566A2F
MSTHDSRSSQTRDVAQGCARAGAALPSWSRWIRRRLGAVGGADDVQRIGGRGSHRALRHSGYESLQQEQIDKDNRNGGGRQPVPENIPHRSHRLQMPDFSA